MKTVLKLLCSMAVLFFLSCEKEYPLAENSNPAFTLKSNPGNNGNNGNGNNGNGNNGNNGNGNHGNHGNNGNNNNGNNGNHFGNAPAAQDSALLLQTDTLFPPLLTDTIAFPVLVYITGPFAAHDTITGGFIVNVSGNYDISVTVHRQVNPSNLMLFVNSNMVFDTGPVSGGTVSLQQSLNLNAGDHLYLRTLDVGNILFPLGSFFKLVRN